MKKIIALLGITAFSCGVVRAADIVYPQGKYNRTSHDNVYFMGRLEDGETLIFQNENIKPASNGAFVINFPVASGRSQALMRICKDGRCTIKQYFIIKNRTKNLQTVKAPVLIPTGRTMLLTQSDDTKLYATPECGDMNILSHMAGNTALIVDGRQEDFYRVYLTPTRWGWVHKNDVKMDYDSTGYPKRPSLADFYNVDDKTVPDLSLYRVAFSRNLPYEIVDNPNELIINIFNVAGMNEETLILKVSKHELVKYSAGFINGDFTLLMKGCKRQVGAPLTGFNIVVDAGHGGHDGGALGIFRDREKDINLDVALALKTELEKEGATVYLTRGTDYDVPVCDRIKLAKANDANLFISIHMGETPQGRNPLEEGGTAVKYYNESAKQLAANIMDGLTSKLSTRDAGIKRSGDDVLQPTEYLGVSIDMCNMVNPEDTVIYRSKDFTRKAVAGISSGIVKYASGKRNANDSGTITNLPGVKPDKKEVKKKWYEFFKRQDTGARHKRVKVKPQKAPEAINDAGADNGTDWLNSTYTGAEDKAGGGDRSGRGNRLFKRGDKDEVKTGDDKPFLDTSVREKYRQEAIYFIDKNDTKWYRPRGKKKRVKRPPRAIKQEKTLEEKSVNIFASGDYEEETPLEIGFGERCRNFFSKFASYFYNAARN